MEQQLIKELSFQDQREKVVILVGGRNSRLHSMEVPKAMMRVNGSYLIDYTLNFLKSNGFEDITVIGNEKDIEFFRSHSPRAPIPYEYLYEKDDMGTGNSLRRLAHMMHDSEDIILLNPSVISDVDIKSACRYHKQQKKLITVLKPNNQRCKSEFGILTCNQLLEYLLNFNPYNSSQALNDSIPIIIVNKTVLTFLMPKKYLDFKENILLPLLDLSSRFVTGIEIHGTCHSIFNFHDLNHLNNMIEKNNIESSSTILSILPRAYSENLPLIKKANPLNGKNKNSTLTTECRSQFGNTSHPDYNSKEAFPSTFDRPYLLLKRSFDILFSAVALIMLSPLFLIIYFLIKIESRGPGFYIHERLGFKAKKLKLIKFRTMVPGSEKLFKNEDEKRDFYRQFKIQNDIRITRLGKYLRKYSIDELPQFLNVLLGSMTLVGPRPIILEEAEWYGIHLPLLLSVKPGITSFWSIKGRNQIPYPHRANIELDYVNKMSFLTDLNVLFKTITSIFINTGL
jgi:lipopolysaccharide/colanic/teichoic acid biosynthesis glycosyltransferase/ADP-glucose pyrophosphorylase